MKKKILALCLVVVLVATAITGVTLAYFTDVTDTATNTFTVGNVDIELDEPNWNPKENGNNIMPGAEFPKDPTITVAADSEDCYMFLDVTLNKYKSLAPTMAKYAVAKKYISQELFDSFCETENDKPVFKTSKFLNHFMNNDMATLRIILNDWFVGIDHADWKIVKFGYDCARDDIEGTGNWLTLRLAYIGGAEGSEGPILSAGDKVQFMEKFVMPADVTEDMLDHNLTKNMFYDGGEFIIDFTAYAIQAQEFEVGGVDAAYTAYFAQNK